jgi:amphi-Trp domain-containing protein
MAMGKETTLFESEEKKDIQNVADFLRQLADKIEQKQVVLRQGTEELTLELPHTVNLEIKVEDELKKTKTKRSLEIEIEWYLGQNDEPDSGITLG